jgi:predicted phage replisome organizer
MAGRYYWLKLRKDFFERHDIKLLERMPDGKDYIIFYLKLLLESVDSEGELLFRDNIPYTNEMLGAVTNTDENIVNEAMELFTKYNMIERNEGVIYMNDTADMTGGESESAKRVRKHREKKTLQSNSAVTKSNTEIEKEIEKEKDTEIELEAEEVEIAPPRGLPQPQSIAIAPMDAISRAWQDAKMSPMSSATRKSIDDYIKSGMDSYCIEYAILEADRNDKRSFAYINGILKRLREQNILTREALELDVKKDKKATSGRCEGELPPDDYFRLHNSWDEL